MDIEIKEAKRENIESILNLMHDYYCSEGIEFVNDSSHNALIGIITNNNYGKL